VLAINDSQFSLSKRDRHELDHCEWCRMDGNAGAEVDVHGRSHSLSELGWKDAREKVGPLLLQPHGALSLPDLSSCF